MAVEVKVVVSDPPSTADKLTGHLDRAFAHLARESQRQGARQEQLLSRVTAQQDRLLNALHDIHHAVRATPDPDMSGLLKMLDRQWEGFLRTMKATQSSQTVASLPDMSERFDRLEKTLQHSGTLDASPALLQRFDGMVEAIRKMRPKTYGIMR